MARSYADIKAQKDGKKRDGFCQICGSKDHLEGHHVFDHQYGGAPHKDNIVTLCKEHHKKVHKGKIDIDIF